MRLIYWGLVGVSIILLMLALVYFQVPDTPNIDQDVLRGWYVSNTLSSVLLGGLIGVAAGLLCERLLSFGARESAESYNSRVAIFGLIAAAIAAVISIALSTFIAVNESSWQMAEIQRVRVVSVSGRFFSVPAASFLLTALVFSAATRARAWSGRHALLPW